MPSEISEITDPRGNLTPEGELTVSGEIVRLHEQTGPAGLPPPKKDQQHQENFLSPRRFRKKQRITAERVIGILRQADRGEQTIGGIYRAPGVPEPPFYRWRQNFAGRRRGQAKLAIGSITRASYQ